MRENRKVLWGVIMVLKKRHIGVHAVNMNIIFMDIVI